MIANSAGASFVNSMHGLRLHQAAKAHTAANCLLILNSATMLGAEIFGRCYGGGILKMEPREAASLPMPGPEALAQAWATLKDEREHLNRQLRNGFWTTVVKRVDEVLLRDTLGLSASDIAALDEATQSLRARRLGRAQ